MNIARIKDGIVVNIEVATQEWVDQNQGVDGFLFLPYGEDELPHVGLGWSEEGGYEQPPMITI